MARQEKFKQKIFSALRPPFSSHCALYICIMHGPNLPHRQKYLLNHKSDVLLASIRQFLQYNSPLGLPWWRSGWESACQCRGHEFEPWSGRIPHAVEQLGPWATTTEPARLEPVLRNKRGRDDERPAHCDEEWPPLAATRESPHTETKTQHSHK